MCQNYYNIQEDTIEEFEYVTNASSGKPLDIEVIYTYHTHNWDLNLPIRDVITQSYSSFLDMSPGNLKVFSIV